MTDRGLRDVRVVEMGQLLAGPFCGQELDHNAEIYAGLLKLTSAQTAELAAADRARRSRRDMRPGA